MRKIAVLGGGNGAHAMAADLSLAGHEVSMYELPRFKKNIEVALKRGEIEITGLARRGTAKLNRVTTNIQEAIKDAEFIMVVVPSFGHKAFAEVCAPYLGDGQTIVLWPGNMGSLEFARILKEEHVERDIVLAETSTLPYGCRLIGPAQVDCMLLATKFSVAAFPAKNTEEVVKDLREIYPITEIDGLRMHQIISGTNVVEVALSNPNPIIHPPATLLNAGRIEYSRGEFYLYREGITRSVQRVIRAVYEEILDVGKALGVNPIMYDEDAFRSTLSAMAEIFQAPFDTAGIIAGVKGPFDMQDRYVTEDIPYGLVPVSQLGDLLTVPTPVIDTQITLLSVINQTNYWKEGRTLEKLGISKMSKEELQKFLMEGRV